MSCGEHPWPGTAADVPIAVTIAISDCRAVSDLLKLQGRRQLLSGGLFGAMGLGTYKLLFGSREQGPEELPSGQADSQGQDASPHILRIQLCRLHAVDIERLWIGRLTCWWPSQTAAGAVS